MYFKDFLAGYKNRQVFQAALFFQGVSAKEIPKKVNLTRRTRRVSGMCRKETAESLFYDLPRSFVWVIYIAQEKCRLSFTCNFRKVSVYCAALCAQISMTRTLNLRHANFRVYGILQIFIRRSFFALSRCKSQDHYYVCILHFKIEKLFTKLSPFHFKVLFCRAFFGSNSELLTKLKISFFSQVFCSPISTHSTRGWEKPKHLKFVTFVCHHRSRIS